MDNILKVSSNFDWILEITFVIACILIVCNLVTTKDRFSRENLSSTFANAGLAVASFAAAMRFFLMSGQDQFSAKGVERLIIGENMLVIVVGIFFAAALVVYFWNKFFHSKS